MGPLSSATVVFSRRFGRSLGVPPVCGLGLARVAAMRNLKGALGQQPVDGADWHWQRSCNVAPVRQGKGTLAPPHAALWQKNGAYW